MQQFPHGLGALLIESGASSLLGGEEPATRAARPRSLKSWIASRTYSREPHPNERAGYCLEARSPLELARMIWARRMTKASLERRALSNCSFSVSESERTKMGGLMVSTIASYTTPILEVHQPLTPAVDAVGIQKLTEIGLSPFPSVSNSLATPSALLFQLLLDLARSGPDLALPRADRRPRP